MNQDTQQPCEPKDIYRVRNWPQYNAGLISRGDVSLWIDESLLVVSLADVARRGRPCLYCDALIQGLLVLKRVFRLTLRAFTTDSGPHGLC